MAFDLLNRRPKKKPLNQFVTDPTQLTPTARPARPTFQFDFKSLPGGATQIRRQTTEQANRPPVPDFIEPNRFNLGNQFRPHSIFGIQSPGLTSRPTPDTGMGSRVFNTAVLPAGANVTGPQFPFQLRKGISSDASRQGAFQRGFASGEGRTGFARRSLDTFFDPRNMFDPNFQRFMLQERLRRQNGF